MRWVAILVMAAGSALAQDDPISTALDEITVLTCALGDDVGLVAYRERPSGEVNGLGAFLGTQIVKEGDRLTILDGADVLSIDRLSATSIQDGVVSTGRCTDAGEAFQGLIGALLSTGLEDGQEDLLAQVENLKVLLFTRILEGLDLEERLDAAEARAADAEAAAERVRLELRSRQIREQNSARFMRENSELRDQLEEAEAALEQTKDDVACAAAVRIHLVSNLFIDELSQVERQTVGIMADTCGVVMGPPEDP